MELVAQSTIQAPVERCFDLARSIDFHADSSKRIAGVAVGGKTTGLAGLDNETVWSARFFGVRFKLTTQIVAMEAPHSFEDRMVRGLLKRFGHRYTFDSLGPDTTQLTDTFVFECPAGYVGRLADRWILYSTMNAVLQERIEQLKVTAESDTLWQAYVP